MPEVWDPSRWQRIDALLAKALTLPEQLREQWLGASPSRTSRSLPACASPGPCNLDDVVIEPRHVPLASFGLTSSPTYWGNGILTRSDRPQLVAALGKAAEALVTLGQDPRPQERGPCPPLDGLWWRFSPESGAWLQSSPTGVSLGRLLVVLRALA
jgi:hypothetical protein